MTQLKILTVVALIICAYSFGVWTTSNHYEKKISEQAATQTQKEKNAIETARDTEQQWQSSANELALKLAQSERDRVTKDKELARLINEHKRQTKTCGSDSNASFTVIDSEWVRIYNDSLH